MRWRRWCRITQFLPWQMSSRGSLMRRVISILQWERWRLAPIVWSMRSVIHPLKKGLFYIKVWLCCPSSYFGEDDGAVFSLHRPLSFFTVPQTKSCKSIKSSERSTALGVIMTCRRQPIGRGRALHTWTHTDIPSTPFYSKLARQSTDSFRT